jgi:hypothetical protein
VYLNGLCEGDYRGIFDTAMALLRWEGGELRGEEYLTPAIEAELCHHYTRRDLLLSSVTAWATKR